MTASASAPAPDTPAAATRHAPPATGHSPETLFISDLHLSPERPATVDLFLDFLAGRARGADRLFILGDLFEAWIGDDDDTPPYPAIRSALRGLTRAGTGCAIVHGNRDFLIGRAFCRETGCTLIREPYTLELDAERVLLMHGDLLCTDDLPYQRFRRRVRNPLVKALFRSRPLAARRAVAESYRQRSALATADKTERIMDVNADTVIRYLRRLRARRLVHGHTHRPADHRLEIAGHPAWRMVLAEWHPQRGEVLVHRPGEWRRESVEPQGAV